MALGVLNFFPIFLFTKVTWQSLSKSLNEIPQSYILDGPNPPISYLITGLEKLTLYGVFVYATNERGRGVDSEQVNITTDAIGIVYPIYITYLFMCSSICTVACAQYKRLVSHWEFIAVFLPIFNMYV